jgi:flagellar assembly protein FliH
VQVAGQEAERIVERARAEADQIRVAALRAGYAEGQARGLDEWADQRRHLGELVTQIGIAYEKFCERQVPGLAALAAAAAEKLLHEQLSLEPERVLTIVTLALEQVQASTRMTVHLNPDDLPLVSAHRSRQAARQTPPVHLQPDPAVERGGCWIDSDQGEVDATVAGKVARLKTALSDDEVMR